MSYMTDDYNGFHHFDGAIEQCALKTQILGALENYEANDGMVLKNKRI